MIEDCKIKNIPTRIFHGLLDDVVNVDYAITIYKKLKTCNANVQLTIFDDAGHDSWSKVYDNQEIYDWMFKQIKTDEKMKTKLIILLLGFSLFGYSQKKATKRQLK